MPLRSARLTGDPFLESCLNGTDRIFSGRDGLTVMRLQSALLDVGLSVGTAGADGIFGTGTGAAVTTFKTSHGLVPNDPVVGRGRPRRWTMISSSTRPRWTRYSASSAPRWLIIALSSSSPGVGVSGLRPFRLLASYAGPLHGRRAQLRADPGHHRQQPRHRSAAAVSCRCGSGARRQSGGPVHRR